MTSTYTRPDYRVDLPEGRHGNVEVRRLTIGKPSPLDMLRYGSRVCQEGEYTALYRNGGLWMSDTTAEQDDHRPAIREIADRGGRVLVGRARARYDREGRLACPR